MFMLLRSIGFIPGRQPRLPRRFCAASLAAEWLVRFLASFDLLRAMLVTCKAIELVNQLDVIYGT